MDQASREFSRGMASACPYIDSFSNNKSEAKLFPNGPARYSLLVPSTTLLGRPAKAGNRSVTAVNILGGNM